MTDTLAIIAIIITACTVSTLVLIAWTHREIAAYRAERQQSK